MKSKTSFMSLQDVITIGKLLAFFDENVWLQNNCNRICLKGVSLGLDTCW